MLSKKKRCPRCNKKATELKAGYCPPCRKTYFQDYYRRNKTRICARVEANRKADPKKHLAARRTKNRKLRVAVIDAYGGACQCCGEDRIEFLAIDHANGGGKKHRLEVANIGSAFYAWLKRNAYPKNIGLRVLCHNCNQSLGLYGYCPHTAASQFTRSS